MQLLRVSVVTPSLNKSFKFQSDWPYNNSQVYLLNSILEDLDEDEDREFKTTKDGYYFSSSVHYPNNRSLVSQNVYVNKDGKILKTEVVDKDGNVQISMSFNKIEYNKKFDKNYFELSQLLKLNHKEQKEDQSSTDNKPTNETPKEEQNQKNNNAQTTTNKDNSSTDETTSGNNQESANNTKTTATIDDVVYPMYLPGNTYLTSQETLDTKSGQRLILTFGGDSPFILVEETINQNEDGLIIPVSGEFGFLSDVIGVIGTNCISWQSNGIEYYMTSQVIETAELAEIARSISVLPVSK